MENRKYIRIQGDKFGFVMEGIHDIHEDTDFEITKEDYDLFFELQTEGKQFKVKDNPIGAGLFDFLEETEPEPALEYISLEERIEALESIMLEVISDV